MDDFIEFIENTSLIFLSTVLILGLISLIPV